MIEFSTEFGRGALRLLNEARVIWLTTVGPGGVPQPRPVWFTWDGQSLLIYSQAKAHKIRHLEQNPAVALNFNTDAEGSEVVVLTGDAHVDREAPPANQNSDYMRKYREAIAGLEMTPEEFSADYSVPIRVTPAHLRGS